MITITYLDRNAKVQQSFDSEQEYKHWLDLMSRIAWSEHCQGLGDGSLAHLQITICE